MPIELPPHVENKIQDFVDGANFRTPSEVVEAALDLLSQRCETSSEKLKQLRTEIGVGIAEADRGELLDAEQVFDEIEQQILGPDDEHE